MGGNIIQFNRDGEALLYDKLVEVGKATEHLMTNIVTNGQLLWERRKELLRFKTITVSVIKNNFDQFENVRKFVEWTKKPQVSIKFLGSYHNPDYEALGLKTLRRVIHNPKGDWDYKTRHKPLVPELGVCLDFLIKPSIDWRGRMFICNRYDPECRGMIGDVTKNNIRSIWTGALRTQWLEYHLTGKREKIPICKTCEFWGIPRYV